MNHDTDALFPLRINRTSFFIRGVVLLLAGIVASGMMSLSGHCPLFVKIVLIGGGVSLFLFLCVALFRSILIPRIRDMGLHPAWSLLIFVHALNSFFVLALLLVPSNAFASRSDTTFR
jgi:uncharacterized membrane protein YhaH (DUF805 family)